MFGESSKVLKRLKFCLSESEHWELALTCFAAEKTLIYELVSQEHDIKPNLLRDSLLQNCLRHFPVFARAQHGSRYKRNFLPLIRNFQVFRTVENADFLCADVCFDDAMVMENYGNERMLFTSCMVIFTLQFP